MPGLSETIARLATGRGTATGDDRGRDGAGGLVPLPGFAPDPGSLDARVHVPDGLMPGSPLVVVLHGCTQDAAAYDRGSGWSTLADRHGFALLFPEQSRRNNPNRCFNWFVARDIARDTGEAASIRAMVARMVAVHGIDPARVFVTGLSAGGAMAVALLAAYPEVFAGGAVIAGLPYGCASGVGEAMDRMAGRGLPDAGTLARRARAAAGTQVDPAWPTLSVWQGDADPVVAPGNADAIVAQFGGLHGLDRAPSSVETLPGGHRRARWTGADGMVAIEAWRIAGLGHGTPIDAKGGVGAAGPHMLDVGIDSTGLIAEGWGLTRTVRAAARRPEPIAPPRAARPMPKAGPRRRPASVTGIIEDALRAAGLMR